jgi:hypothetical protein
VSWPVGRWSLPAVFSHRAATRAAQGDAGLTGAAGGQCLTPPQGMAGTVRQRGWGAEAIEVPAHGPGDLRGSPGAGTLSQALPPLGGQALAPRAQRGRGQGPRGRNGGEALPGDDVAYGWGTPAHTRRLRLLQEALQGRQGVIGQREFAGPHGRGLQKKRRDNAVRHIAPRSRTTSFRLKFLWAAILAG